MPSVQEGMNIVDTVSFTGGINVSSLGIAVSLMDRLMLGYSFDYNFGTIQENWGRVFPNNKAVNTSLYIFNNKYKSYGSSFGLHAKVYKNTAVGIGYTLKSELKKDLYSRLDLTASSDTFILSKTMSMPAAVRFGVCSDVSDRLKGQMDLTLTKWKDAARSVKEKEMYTDTYRFGTGIRFVPSTRMNAPYYKKLPLSAGFSIGTLYYKSYPRVNTISEKAVTLGIEFPFKENIGCIVTSFEYGIRGDKSKNGWDETFVGLGISLIGMIK
jgi:hypothetical protein